MHLTTKLHTIFLLVGPSMCGKSTFSRELEKALLRAGQKEHLNYSISVLSSDSNRWRLLGDSRIDKHAPSMLEVSGQAFEMLFTDLKAVTSYPVNHDFVIVDTTGLSEKFRDDVREIARSQGYSVELVLFEYSKPELLRGIDEKYHPVMLTQLSRMKRDVFPKIRAKDYTKRIKIHSRDPDMWKYLEVTVENAAEYRRCLLHLDPTDGVAVIGDTHEHVDALTKLIKELDALDPNLRKIHIGDYLDKGGNTEAMLRLMKQRADAGDIIIHGNHEAYVVRRLRGEIDPNPDLEDKYITSLKVLLERPDLQEILFDLYDNHSVPFLKITGDDCRTMYVTHAPCDEVHLGKLSPFAIKAQRNLYSKDRSDDYRHAYGFVFDQASSTRPLHVFGHVAHKSSKLAYRNKIFLDTGAVYGHKLTALVYKGNSYQPLQISTERLDTTDHELSDQLTQPIKAEKPFDIKDYNLEPKEVRFINGLIKRGIKFISGTMSPAPSTETTLESLDAGLNYFRKHGVTEVVMQPKYMGSRCQLYLYKDPEKQSFAVSRNGYVISPERVPGLEDVISHWLSKVDGWCDGNWKELIIDGELLPWSALGKGLIEDQFRSYGTLIGWELEQLNDPAFAALDFNAKPDLEDRKEDLRQYWETLSLYDKDTGDGEGQVPLEFKAFAFLSVDGNDLIRSADQFDDFNVLNDDGCHLVNFNDEDSIRQAHEFYRELTVDKGMEGVVLKPRHHTENVVPYMKVRNEGYLRLVYGYDYPRRYAALCRQKNISGKLSISLKEWDLGRRMLIAKSDNEMTELAVKMIGQLKREQELDPRL